MRHVTTRLARWAPWLPALTVLLVPLLALARGGSGENYTRGNDRDSGGDGGGDILYILFELLTFAFRYPKLGIPLLILFGVGYWFYRRNLHPTGATQRAFEQREAEQRTQVSGRDVQGWVNALKLKDPAFELQPVLDRVGQLFMALQEAWFKRDMSPVRPFLSDATYQRFNVQLALMQAQGVRDAIADIQVLDVQLVGLSQSQWFDNIHVRIRARMRDTDVPASTPDAQAVAAAHRAPSEAFTEVWTFVRKPGAQTRLGEGLFQGKCPNCGAPFKGGAANSCEFCGAVVNSGNYDWTLSEITQGIEFVRHHTTVDGLMQAREADPALNLEIMEDRASLLFWKWIDAQSRAEPERLAKVANAEALTRLSDELEGLRRHGRRRVFLECAVGGVNVRSLELHPTGFDKAHVEIRWSARMGVGPANQRPPELPTVPQRWVFTLLRKHGAQTNTANGMSTSRCPQCNAPLTDSAATTCDFCGTQLGSGERDWVLASALTFEQWNVQESQHYQAAVLRKALERRPMATGVSAEVGANVGRGARAPEDTGADAGVGAQVVTDVRERERLLYMMAAIAAADGQVGPNERRMLKLCSERWSIPWQNVEMALSSGPQLFERLVPRGSPEAEVFLRHIVDMALVDGRIDRQERRMLETAAAQLGVPERLQEMLDGQ
jgi:tellurite resistance protein